MSPLTLAEKVWNRRARRTVYFRREMAGPIVDLDRVFNEPTDTGAH